MFKVGDKVTFIGPAYKFLAGGPLVGEHGEVVEANGATMRSEPGGQPEELVVVEFVNRPRPRHVVVNVNRLKLQS